MLKRIVDECEQEPRRTGVHALTLQSYLITEVVCEGCGNTFTEDLTDEDELLDDPEFNTLVLQLNHSEPLRHSRAGLLQPHSVHLMHRSCVQQKFGGCARAAEDVDEDGAAAGGGTPSRLAREVSALQAVSFAFAHSIVRLSVVKDEPIREARAVLLAFSGS